MQLENHVLMYSRKRVARVDPESARSMLFEMMNVNLSDRPAVLRFLRRFAHLLPRVFRGYAWALQQGEAEGVSPRKLWESKYADDADSLSRSVAAYHAITKPLSNPEIVKRLMAESATELPFDKDPVLLEIATDWLESSCIEMGRAWERPTPLEREMAVLMVSATYMERTEIDIHPDYRPFPRRSLVARAGDPVRDLRESWFLSDPFLSVLLHGVRFAGLMRYCPNSECPAPYFIANRRSQKYCSDACSVPAQRQFKREWWSQHGTEWRGKRKAKEARKRKSLRKKGEK